MMEEMKNAEPVLTLNPFEEMGKEPQAPAVPAAVEEAAVEEKKEAAVLMKARFRRKNAKWWMILPIPSICRILP